MHKSFCFLILISVLLFFSSANTAQTSYKMYCFYTPKFETLFKDYFLPSLKDNFELVVYEYPDECLSGEFRTNGWDKIMLKKLNLLQNAILENWNNQAFFYSDIDIIFLKPILELSLKYLGENDFVAQQGWPRNGICAGFLVMKGNEKTLKLVNSAYTLLNRNIYLDDQQALQAVLDDCKQDDIQWKLLPSEFYPNGRRLMKQTEGHYSNESEIEMNDSMVLFHANCCIGLKNKYDFLIRVQELFLKNQNLKNN